MCGVGKTQAWAAANNEFFWELEMKKLLSASVALAMMATPVFAADVKLGIILGYTGPIESLTPDMAMGAELAISEANESGEFMDGINISSVRGDSTCIDLPQLQPLLNVLLPRIKSMLW